MRIKKWYQRRLAKYFDDNYQEDYADKVEWHVDPAINSWKFYDPEQNRIVVLICEEDGSVREER